MRYLIPTALALILFAPPASAYIQLGHMTMLPGFSYHTGTNEIPDITTGRVFAVEFVLTPLSTGYRNLLCNEGTSDGLCVIWDDGVITLRLHTTAGLEVIDIATAEPTFPVMLVISQWGVSLTVGNTTEQRAMALPLPDSGLDLTFGVGGNATIRVENLGVPDILGS